MAWQFKSVNNRKKKNISMQQNKTLFLTCIHGGLDLPCLLVLLLVQNQGQLHHYVLVVVFAGGGVYLFKI